MVFDFAIGGALYFCGEYVAVSYAMEDGIEALFSEIDGGDFTRFSSENFPEQKEMTKDDHVVVCGDFGFWDESKEQKHWRKWLSEKPFTTLFIDGNHENFDLLNVILVQDWHGGKVHFVTDSIIHNNMNVSDRDILIYEQIIRIM